MESTMQQGALTVAGILRYGSQAFPDAEVITYDGTDGVRACFSEVAERAARLAGALAGIGISPSDRVGTFCFNHQQHLEAYLGIPAMGAVIHTLNLRLAPDQLGYVIDDAGDRAIIADGMMLPQLAQVLEACPSVATVIVVGATADAAIKEQIAKRCKVLDYEEFLRDAAPVVEWPDVVETDAAMICYSSGTTGNPKGVVYSHRSTYLHAISALPLYSQRSWNILESKGDVALIVVPMFHAAAWGAPYACWFTGSTMIMPGRFLQAEPLAAMIERFHPTLSSGVPTIWNDLLNYLESHPTDVSSLRMLTSGGSATPRSLIETYLEHYNIPVVSGWGMTETSPVCTLAIPPSGTPRERLVDYLATAGKVVPGVELRIVDDQQQVQPWDGKALGEIEVRGPWITAGYLGGRGGENFDDGWLRTGDIATVDREGYVRIVDRTKDVIKSGGEWISSIELENAIMAHPKVAEAAVIAVPDDRWFERPLAFVVVKPGEDLEVGELRDFLATRIVKWWLPERFSFVEAIPRTSVGKFHKKVLREGYQAGNYAIHEVKRTQSEE
ncbi:MAG: long-chain fatty acid--CoA ligase [Ferrimicrobium sp.]|uniref:long-chain fatty acid--CoA ligase n=1 Tax=Ferrimicrobium sp. TaxID=2926050 RepID=UPI00260401D3|nr:long-chain fatty acid--CoA ligase [Ferrimicrobium sp.]